MTTGDGVMQRGSLLFIDRRHVCASLDQGLDLSVAPFKCGEMQGCGARRWGGAEFLGHGGADAHWTQPGAAPPPPFAMDAMLTMEPVLCTEAEPAGVAKPGVARLSGIARMRVDQ